MSAPKRSKENARPRTAVGRLRYRLGLPPRPGEARGIAAVFAIAAVVLAANPLLAASPVPVGRPAPDFSLPTTQGGSYALSTDLGRTPIMLEFMHPDCSHCHAMGPTLQQAHADYGARVRFVAVAVRLPGFSDPTAQTVGAFAASYGHDWTYLIDDGTRVRDLYGVQGTPTFFFINGTGPIALELAGEIPLTQLESALAQIGGT